MKEMNCHFFFSHNDADKIWDFSVQKLWMTLPTLNHACINFFSLWLDRIGLSDKSTSHDEPWRGKSKILPAVVQEVVVAVGTNLKRQAEIAPNNFLRERARQKCDYRQDVTGENWFLGKNFCKTEVVEPTILFSPAEFLLLRWWGIGLQSDLARCTEIFRWKNLGYWEQDVCSSIVLRSSIQGWNLFRVYPEFCLFFFKLLGHSWASQLQH